MASLYDKYVTVNHQQMYTIEELHTITTKPPFECGPGWTDLICKLINDLNAISTDWYAMQIKEKFGMLRFYIGLGESITKEQSTKMYDLIDIAENQSGLTCEECGKEGKIACASGGYWLKTLCKECCIRLDYQYYDEEIEI